MVLSRCQPRSFTLAHVISQADGNSETPSFVARSLKKGGEDRAVRDAAATMYNGGTDTVSPRFLLSYDSISRLQPDACLQTVVTILNFVLAMLDNPSMQRRAQRDLDAVLGPLRGADGELGRLPVFDDEERLPYITALARESSRYRPVLPMVRLLARWQSTSVADLSLSVHPTRLQRRGA